RRGRRRRRSAPAGDAREVGEGGEAALDLGDPDVGVAELGEERPRARPGAHGRADDPGREVLLDREELLAELGVALERPVLEARPVHAAHDPVEALDDARGEEELEPGPRVEADPDRVAELEGVATQDPLDEPRREHAVPEDRARDALEGAALDRGPRRLARD